MIEMVVKLARHDVSYIICLGNEWLAQLSDFIEWSKQTWLRVSLQRGTEFLLLGHFHTLFYWTHRHMGHYEC